MYESVHGQQINTLLLQQTTFNESLTLYGSDAPP